MFRVFSRGHSFKNDADFKATRLTPVLATESGA